MVPDTKYTSRTKKRDGSNIRLNAMNGWSDEGKDRFRMLFHLVSDDRDAFGRSFNRRFKDAFDWAESKNRDGKTKTTATGTRSVY